MIIWIYQMISTFKVAQKSSGFSNWFHTFIFSTFKYVFLSLEKKCTALMCDAYGWTFSHFAKSLVKVSLALNGIDCRFNGTLRPIGPIDTCDTCVGKFLIAIQCHLANMHTFLKLFLLKIFKVTQIFGLDIPFRAWTHCDRLGDLTAFIPICNSIWKWVQKPYKV